MDQHILFTKLESEITITDCGGILFPDIPEKPGVIEPKKEYIAGYFETTSESKIKEITKNRNHILKIMRGRGWQTFTEPCYFVNGRDKWECPFSMVRVVP